MKKITIIFILLIFLDDYGCINLTPFVTIATIKLDDEKGLDDAISKLNKSGGVIYIDTPIIHIFVSTLTKKLSGSKLGQIIGIQQSDGSYQIIDFTHARRDTNCGFEISGSYQFLKYLIIQNSWTGIRITGSRNNLEHIITRYNLGSGIQISDNAISNSLHYCYSYRNLDFSDYSANASGFFLKPGSGQTFFSYCFSFDNSDKGWDVNDKEGDSSVAFHI